jgi:predicted AAA+ superfamily ATPase
MLIGTRLTDLKACGEDAALVLMNTISVPPWAEEKLEALFKTYTLIGGMPEAVDRYLGTGISVRKPMYTGTFSPPILTMLPNTPEPKPKKVSSASL